MKKSIRVIAIILFFYSAIHAQCETTAVEKHPAGPGSYEILEPGGDPIHIPFRMHRGKPLMEVEVNCRAATLMIDNGVLWDQVWLFGSPLVEELGLEPVEEGTIGGSGSGDPTAAYTSSDLTLKFRDIIFHGQPVLVSPPSAGFANMFPGVDGQLCNTFFRHFIVEFDFIRNEILLHDPERFEYKGDGSILEMKVDEVGTYSVPFSFIMLDGSEFSDRVDIDLGGIYAFKAALGTKHRIRPPSETEQAESYGAQGLMREAGGKIKSMRIGDYTFENPTVYFGDAQTSRIHPDNLGVIGLPLFMRFDIIFDYFNDRLILEPNENNAQPFE